MNNCPSQLSTEPAARRARLTSMSRSRLRTCTLVLAGLVALSLVGCTSAGSHGASVTASRRQLMAQPTGSFLTVTSTFDVERNEGLGNYMLIKYGVATLQVRSTAIRRQAAAR
jgi:hypothetical protein